MIGAVVIKPKESHHLSRIFGFLTLTLFSVIFVLGFGLDVASVPEEFALLDDALHFEIHWPESLRYTFRLRQARNFGTEFNKTFENIQLVSADPEDACQELYNDVQGAVVLILRGGCSFLSKTKIAEAAGAVAAIISDNDEVNDMSMIDMVDDNSQRTVNIPSVFLMGKDGSMIRQKLHHLGAEYAIITIPLNLTGKAVIEARRPPWSLW